MAILNNSNAISSGGYDINNSLRFRSSASAYLNRTPASAGNRKTWTYSTWIKRGLLDPANTDFDVFAAGASDGALIRFQSGGSYTMRIYDYNGSSFFMNLITTQVFRDPSAWYHIVLAVDSTQATSSNRVKLYVNGTQVTAFSTAVYPSLNQDCTHFNNNVIHNIGRNPFNAAQYYDGYMTEINFVDGQALTPSSFGETDTTTGSWKPKAYSGTYGTNGFELTFSDIATTSGSNAGLGKDFSGNANYWTTNNISVTAGVTYDAMTDVPTNTSATVANYAVLNPLIKTSTGWTMSNGNLTLTDSSSGGSNQFGTIAVNSGKYYFECSLAANTDFYVGVGYISTLAIITAYRKDGTRFNGSSFVSYGASYTTNDIIGCAFDIDSGTIEYFKNGTSQGQITGISYSSGSVTPEFYSVTGGSYNANFGQRPFSYTPPTGFNRLNTYNLPDSTIKKGNTVMDAVTYTGDGTTRTVSNLGFTPDFVWTKSRSNAISHILCDRVRGNYLGLSSDLTGAEGYNNYTQFNAAGSNSYNQLDVNNANAYTYVNWIWKADNTSGSSNTSGSITSTVSVNATAGFSVVTYSGTNSASTIGHGLGVAPKFIIVKTRSGTENWNVYHASLGNGSNALIYLNLTNAVVTGVGTWNNTAPTSSVFSVTGNNLGVNQSGQTYVAYCWAEIAGFSKFGSYTGNGSADGPFIFTNFKPEFLMFKRTDTTSGWYIHDSTRNTSNVVNLRLLPNTSDAEATVTTLDFLSNGFKLRTSDVDRNASGGTYIYMAFAENPFKNSLAR